MGLESIGFEERLVTKGVWADGRQLGTLVRAKGAVWSPDGRWLAYIAENGEELRLANLEGEEHTIFQSWTWEPIYAWPSWSPDGDKVAIVTVEWCEFGARISSLIVIDVPAGETRTTYGPYDFWQAGGTDRGPTHFTLPQAIRWSPDGRKILVSWDNAVVIDVETQDAETISTSPILAEWAPASDAVYYFEIKNAASRRDRALGDFVVKKLGSEGPLERIEERRLSALGLAARPTSLGHLLLSPKGSRLAFASSTTVEGIDVVYVYDLIEGEALALDMPTKSFRSDDPIAALEWAPDESGLVALTIAESNIDVRALDLATGRWTTLVTPQVEPGRISMAGKILSWTQ